LKILLVHNFYQQAGGEDEAFHREKNLLIAAGHQVSVYTRHNDEIKEYGLWDKAMLGLRTVWAWDSTRELRTVLRREKPDLTHFHNTFPVVSPAAYYVCRDAGVPVVQSLHNPRLLCPAATLFRKGHLCEDCVRKKLPWPGILHACYRNSRIETSGAAAMLAVHRALKTWEKRVDAYIVYTEFFRRKFVEGGLPAEKILIKPGFVDPDPGMRTARGDYALFMGRLAPEKGVLLLLEAWRQLGHIPLKIRGDGPLAGTVQAWVSANGNCVQVVPRLAPPELEALLKGARFLVWPSGGYYEAFGLVAIEAFACGVPVIASGLGAMAEIVTDGRTGLHFTHGDAADLAAKVDWAWAHSKEMETMGREARAEYEAKYTAERNYQILMNIYQRAMASHFHGVAPL